MKNHKGKIENLIAILFVALFFLFSFVWIIFDFNSSSSALKDSFSIVSSLFGGAATLSAAYIAYLLYDDWRYPHNLNIETEYKKEILKVIRKLSPIEFTYDRLISNHFIYSSNPEFTLPISINDEELTKLNDYLNELLGLLDELYIVTKDEKLQALKSQYYHYAQLYSFILIRTNHLYKSDDKSELIEFLGTRLSFEYTGIDGRKWTSSTLYAYAFTGLQHTKLREYLSESLKCNDVLSPN